MPTKKPIGFALVLALLAMAMTALPALASAAQLTNAKGEGIEPQTITATSTDATTVLTPEGLITCDHVEVHGILTVNDGNEVVIEMDEEGEDSASGCLVNGKSAAVAPTLNTIVLTGHTGSAAFSFAAGGLNVSSTDSTVSWVGTKATTVQVVGEVHGGADGDFTGDFSLFDEKNNPLTVD